MTLVELLVALAIFAVVIVTVTDFYVSINNDQNAISGSFQTSENAQIVLKTILTELRQAEPAVNGAYPLAATGSTSISFFSDPEGNGAAEQVTYSLIGTTLFRAVIRPSGSPAVYSLSNQSTTTLLQNVENGSDTPVFQYFDSNYNGTSTPLVQPVTAAAVRLVKVNVTMGGQSKYDTRPVTYTVQVNLRNLKTNL